MVVLSELFEHCIMSEGKVIYFDFARYYQLHAQVMAQAEVVRNEVSEA